MPVGAGAAASPPGAAPLGRPHISGGLPPAPPMPEVTMITATPQPRLILQSFNGKAHVRVETWDGKHLYTADRQTFELLQQKVPSPPAALPAARPRVNLSALD